ncbi:NAD(P)-dependent dehydrogenase, partial [Klebsiella pneumoniae]
MQDEKPPMKKLPTSMLPEETAPRPEFPEQEQTPPGLDAEMEPSPDHGETSYTGS